MRYFLIPALILVIFSSTLNDNPPSNDLSVMTDRRLAVVDPIPWLLKASSDTHVSDSATYVKWNPDTRTFDIQRAPTNKFKTNFTAPYSLMAQAEGSCQGKTYAT